jgi:hypothetical protein
MSLTKSQRRSLFGEIEGIIGEGMNIDYVFTRSRSAIAFMRRHNLIDRAGIKVARLNENGKKFMVLP